MDILDKVVGAVGIVADVISGSTKIYKSIRGKGVTEEALNEILSADTKTGTGDARGLQFGNGFYFINSMETCEDKK